MKHLPNCTLLFLLSILLPAAALADGLNESIPLVSAFIGIVPAVQNISSALQLAALQNSSIENALGRPFKSLLNEVDNTYNTTLVATFISDYETSQISSAIGQVASAVSNLTTEGSSLLSFVASKNLTSELGMAFAIYANYTVELQNSFVDNVNMTCSNEGKLIKALNTVNSNWNSLASIYSVSGFTTSISTCTIGYNNGATQSVSGEIVVTSEYGSSKQTAALTVDTSSLALSSSKSTSTSKAAAAVIPHAAPKSMGLLSIVYATIYLFW